MGHHQLDTLDEQILKLIADNARIPLSGKSLQCFGCRNTSTHTKTYEFGYSERFGICH